MMMGIFLVAFLAASAGFIPDGVNNVTVETD
jgi:hypothetical protein